MEHIICALIFVFAELGVEGRFIYWMNGLAGTGKTTIAYTVAEKCKREGSLGATFFCSRDDADASNPRLVFMTIANQLGQFYPPFKEQVTRAHAADPELRYSNESTQLEELLVKPLQVLRSRFPHTASLFWTRSMNAKIITPYLSY